MELKNIKDLMTAMGKTGIRRLRVKQDNFELELEREVEKEIPSLGAETAAQTRYYAESRPSDIPPSLHPPLDQPAPVPEITGTFIKSPMVGTFYTSSGPDEPPFVKPGDKVEKETVVCIIEAMKVMNEVKAGAAGTVAEVLIETGHPVEFGTKLFRIS